jgi:hypothetical protein
MFACNVLKDKNVYKKSLAQRAAATVVLCPIKIPQHQMAKILFSCVRIRFTVCNIQ